MSATNLGCVSLGVGGHAPLLPPLNHGTGDFSLLELGPNWGRLTDTSFRAGEAPILWYHVGIVALAGQHLCHIPCSLPLPHLGLQKNSEADVGTVR